MKGNAHTPQGFVDHCLLVAKNNDLRKQVIELRQRVRRLEEEGDRLADSTIPNGRSHERWKEAKKDKP